jgi:hypothetical protein
MLTISTHIDGSDGFVMYVDGEVAGELPAPVGECLARHLFVHIIAKISSYKLNYLIQKCFLSHNLY